MSVNILVADDSVTMRRILEVTFQGEDAQVTTVDSGEAAVRKASELNPDVVFADLSLNGMDGYSIASAIKSSPGLERTAVVVMASQKHPYDEDKGRAAGVDDHILKPFDTQHVIDRVKQVLARPRAMPAAIFERLMPISVKLMPVRRAPFVFGFLSWSTSKLSALPMRGTESLIAPSFALSLLNNQSSSFVCRADDTIATEPAGACLSLSAISLSAAVQLDFWPRTKTSFKRSSR